MHAFVIVFHHSEFSSDTVVVVELVAGSQVIGDLQMSAPVERNVNYGSDQRKQ